MKEVCGEMKENGRKEIYRHFGIYMQLEYCISCNVLVPFYGVVHILLLKNEEKLKKIEEKKLAKCKKKYKQFVSSNRFNH